MESYSPGTADGTESDEEDSAMNDNSEGSDCLESIPVVCKLEPPDDEPPEEPECLETIPVVCKLETAEDDDVTTEDVDLMESMPVVCKLDDPEEGGSGTCLDEEALQDSSVQGFGGKKWEEETRLMCDLLGERESTVEEVRLQVADRTPRRNCDICGLNLAAKSPRACAQRNSQLCMCIERKTKFSLVKHIRAMHESFKCDECDFASEEFNLDNHLRKHDGTKPFECRLCDYSAMTGSLTLHVNCRHAQKGFSCGLCDKVFLRRGELEKHVSGVHARVLSFRCDQYRTTRKPSSK